MSRQTLIPLLLVVLVTSMMLPANLLAQDDETGVTITTTTTTSNMNLHSGPNAASNLIGALSAGTTTVILARHINEVDELWLLVPYENGETWIAGWLVTINGDLKDVPWWEMYSAETEPLAEANADDADDYNPKLNPAG